VDALVQHRLEVEDRRAVDRLESADSQACVLDRLDPDPMQTDRVRAGGGTGGKDARARAGRIAARVDPEGVAVRAVQPGQDDQVVAGAEAVECAGSITIQASGAPSSPCFGAAEGSVRGDST
jgi:hypothetical protein